MRSKYKNPSNAGMHYLFKKYIGTPVSEKVSIITCFAWLTAENLTKFFCRSL